MMTHGDPKDRFFYHILTQTMDFFAFLLYFEPGPQEFLNMLMRYNHTGKCKRGGGYLVNESRVLDPCYLSLEGIGRLCQADLTWKLDQLYYCPWEEGKACVVFVCSQMAILILSAPSVSL